MWGVTRERDAAFTQFAADASASLTSTAWLVSGDREVARDLVQTALLKTYVAWPRVRQADARAFARRALVNAHIDQWRQRHGEVVSTSTVESRTAASDPYEGVDDNDRVARMLATLPPQQRAVVVLRYYEDLSEREVAQTLGISPGAVKSAASRGLAHLRAAATLATKESPR